MNTSSSEAPHWIFHILWTRTASIPVLYKC